MKLLIAYDGSACAEDALDDLRRAGLPEHGEAVVISVGKAWPPPLSEDASARDLAAIVEQELSRAQALSARAADRVRAELPGWQVSAEALVDSPQGAIVGKADSWKPDIVLLGSHGRSAIGRAILGSVSQSVLTHVTCSVRIARRRPQGGRGAVRLVLGIDGSVESATAVSAVALRKWPAASEARVVAVVEAPDLMMQLPASGKAQSTSGSPHVWVTRAVERVAEELRDAGLSVSPLVCEGDPKRVLVDESERWDADCIFVGAKGMSRLDRFLLGSVSLAVAVRAHCSVEVVRQPS